MINQQHIQGLIARYEEVFFTVYRKITADVRGNLGSDLTPDQHYILRCIERDTSCTTTKLAELFYVSKGAITAIVDRLRAKGYVERVADPHDRRVMYLKLTDKGRTIYEQGEEKIQQVVQSYLTQLDEGELVAFVKTYEKLAKIVKQDN